MTPGDILTALRALAPVMADGDALVLPPGTELPAPLLADAATHKPALLVILDLERRLCQGIDAFLWPVEQSWTPAMRRRIRKTGTGWDEHYDKALTLFERLEQEYRAICDGRRSAGSYLDAQGRPR